MSWAHNELHHRSKQRRRKQLDNHRHIPHEFIHRHWPASRPALFVPRHGIGRRHRRLQFGRRYNHAPPTPPDGVFVTVVSGLPRRKWIGIQSPTVRVTSSKSPRPASLLPSPGRRPPKCRQLHRPGTRRRHHVPIPRPRPSTPAAIPPPAESSMSSPSPPPTPISAPPPSPRQKSTSPGPPSPVQPSDTPSSGSTDGINFSPVNQTSSHALSFSTTPWPKTAPTPAASSPPISPAHSDYSAISSATPTEANNVTPPDKRPRERCFTRFRPRDLDRPIQRIHLLHRAAPPTPALLPDIIGSAGANAADYFDNSVSRGTNYQYRVQAANPWIASRCHPHQPF